MHKCPNCDCLTGYNAATNGLCLICERKVPEEERQKSGKFDYTQEPYRP